MGTFEQTIEKLKEEIEGHVETLKANPEWSQVEKLYKALGTIEELASAPRTSLAELFGFSGSDSAVTVKPGEFMGRDAVDAAKLYMERKQGVASSLDEIMDAIQKGGATQINPHALRVSLARSTWDVQKAPGQDLYTLLKFLPHVKRGKKKAVADVAAEAEPPEVEADPDGSAQ